MNILIVDASAESAELIRSPLLKSYSRVFIANTLETAKIAIKDNFVSLVITDWYLPNNQAHELTRWIRTEPVHRYIFQLIVTKSDDQESLLEAFESGADDVIGIPVHPEELMLRISAAERCIEHNATLARKNQRLITSFDQLMQDYMEVSTDLADAGRVQKCLLPSSTNFNSIHAHGFLRPATQLSGDSFDFFRLNQQFLAFYIADAVGHGSASAMVSYAVHHQIKPRAHGICSTNFKNSETIDEAIIKTVQDLNNQFVAENSETNRWFTMIYGLIDITSGEVNLCQAGQPPALHYSSKLSETTEIGTGGFPVGLFEEANYTTNQCKLEPGDKLLLCSDGAIECKTIDDSEFGVENLKLVMHETDALDLIDTADAITDKLIDWNGGETFTDDLSVLLFQHVA